MGKSFSMMLEQSIALITCANKYDLYPYIHPYVTVKHLTQYSSNDDGECIY